MALTEYSARTGEELRKISWGGIAPGTIAATDGGLWLSSRSGMAGSTGEVSASNLGLIAPPLSQRSVFDIYTQITGVWATVSERTLWFSSLRPNAAGNVLRCGDPTTGAIRANRRGLGSAHAE
jgi:hypothetical protein